MTSRHVAALALAMALFAPAASAQGPGPAKGAAPALSPQDEAKARFETGLKYYDARDFESARLAFTQAYAVLKKPGILLNLALSELYASRPVEALGHLDTFLKETDLTPEKRERAQKAREEAYAKTGHLQIKAPAGAEMKLDDELLSPLPPVAHVAVGEHAITSSAGGVTQQTKVDAAAGVVTVVDVTVPKEPPKAPPQGERSGVEIGPRHIAGIALMVVGGGLFGYGVMSIGQLKTDRARIRTLRAGAPDDACTDTASALCSDLAQTNASADRNKGPIPYALGGGIALFVGGGVLLASGLVRTQPKAQTVSVGSGPGQLGLSLSGTF